VSIRLEVLTAARLPDVEALVEDPAVVRFTRVPEPTPHDFAQTWFASYERGREDGTKEAFAIVDASSAFLGRAVAPLIDRPTRTVELGYVIAPEARGRGVATAAVRLLSRWALEELGALRVELWISIHNSASSVVARRCGYTLEGVLRSAHFKQEQRDDFEIWSLLPSDESARVLRESSA
jgi:RimJ/RimL family protein N-acetyltransferase